MKKIFQYNHLYIYIVFILAMIITIHVKSGLHIDESLSYMLANTNNDWIWDTTSFSEQLPSGTNYSPATAPLYSYMVPFEKYSFNYANVLKNQANDVHPPFYYAQLNFLSSIFPGTYSKWFAGIINIFWGCLCLCGVRRTIAELVHSKRFFFDSTHVKFIQNSISVLFIFSAGILHSMAFFRMYVISMALVTLFVAHIFSGMNCNELKLEWYVKLWGISTLGAITHYYTLIPFFSISIFYEFYLLYLKNLELFLALS